MLKTLAPTFAAALLLPGAAAAQDASVTAGHRLAVTDCGGCHSIDRTGDSPKPRAPRFRELGSRYPFEGLRDALVRGMIIGHPVMPIQRLTRTEADNLVAYIKTLQTDQGARRQGDRPAGPRRAQ